MVSETPRSIAARDNFDLVVDKLAALNKSQEVAAPAPAKSAMSALDAQIAGALAGLSSKIVSEQPKEKTPEVVALNNEHMTRPAPAKDSGIV